MNTKVLSLRYREAKGVKNFLESLDGDGMAYLTDRLTTDLPEGGRISMFPGKRSEWRELKRPGDLEMLTTAAAAGADVLYKFPSRGRRRIFVRGEWRP